MYASNFDKYTLDGECSHGGVWNNVFGDTRDIFCLVHYYETSGLVMKKYVTILIVSAKGDLLLHHKNDKSYDNSLDIVSGFEGDLSPSESAAVSAVRVLDEETGLKVRVDDLEFLDSYHDLVSGDGEEIEQQVFVVAGVDEDRVHVYRGQGLWVMRRSDDLGLVPMSAISRKQVVDYFRRHKKR